MAEVIENGIVYQETTAPTYTEKILIGNEFSLLFEGEVTQVGTDIQVAGVIYKERYTGEIVALDSDVTVSVNENELNQFTETPAADGTAPIDILFQGMTMEEAQTLSFSSGGVYGSYTIGGAE